MLEIKKTISEQAAESICKEMQLDELHQVQFSRENVIRLIEQLKKHGIKINGVDYFMDAIQQQQEIHIGIKQEPTQEPEPFDYCLVIRVDDPLWAEEEDMKLEVFIDGDM